MKRRLTVLLFLCVLLSLNTASSEREELEDRSSSSASLTRSPAVSRARRNRWSWRIFARGYTCPDPGTPQHGSRQPQGGAAFPVGARLTYSCNSSYLLRGAEVLECTFRSFSAAAWNAETPQCVALLPNLTTNSLDPCGAPPDPTSFAYITSYITGEHVQYSCIANHTLSSGNKTLQCLNGQWLGSPLYCRRLGQCLDFGGISNGLRVLNGTREGDVVAFRCADGYGLLGARQLTCGSDGNWESKWPQCIREIAQCDNPPRLLHGTRVIHGTREGGFVEYSCIKGYKLQGATRQTCLPSGEWSSTPPTCQKLSCQPPQNTSHGRVHYLSLESGSVASYTCDTGYEMIGKDTLVCNSAGSWSGLPPTCIAVVCSPLRHPLCGYVRQPRLPRFGTVANYSCHIGYGLMGVSSRRCQADGRWSGSSPSCRKRLCGTLSNPKNGRVRMTSFRLGGFAIYSCDRGFRLSGNFVRVCGILSLWSLTAPTCQAVECPSLRSPMNGMVSTTNSNLFRSVATYSCNTGYRLIGWKATRQCGPNGRWTGRPPSCSAIVCRSLNAPHHGFVSYNSTILGSEAVYSCMEDYEIAFGDRIRTCGEGGRWHGVAPCCIRKEITCPDLSPPRNGSVDFGTRVGETANYSCSTGLMLVGNMTRQCQSNGEWSGIEPRCVTSLPPPEDCGDLEDPANGEVDLSQGTLEGDKAVYSCKTGFRLEGPRIRTCSDGKWTGTDPKCELINCGVLLPPLNGEIDLRNGTLLGAVVEYSCNAGHLLNGSESRVCQESGQWSQSQPTCLLRDCGPLRNPANGSVDLSNGTLFGATATYSCAEIFILEGNETKTCLENGTWSGEEPTCNITFCEELQAPENTILTLSNGNFINSVAEYMCTNSSLRLVGDSTRTCTTDDWTGSEPSCAVILCPELFDPANGSVIIGGRTVDAEARYSCNDGFSLVGIAIRRCGEEGEWVPEEPRCIAITDNIMCPVLEDPKNGRISLQTGRNFGAITDYKCDIGFVLNPPNQNLRFCLALGEWSGVQPTCEPDGSIIVCPYLDPPENGQVSITSTQVGATVTFQCRLGYTLNGSSERICTENGTWTGMQPVCDPVNCGLLEASLNGNVDTSSGTTFNDVARYSCNPGFILEGILFVRICQFNAVWSGTAPTCRFNDTFCPSLPDLPNGRIALINGRRVGSFAFYLCDARFSIQPSDFTSRECMDNGQWSKEEPACVRDLALRPAMRNKPAIRAKLTMREPAMRDEPAIREPDNLREAANKDSPIIKEELVMREPVMRDRPSIRGELLLCPSLEPISNGRVEFNRRRMVVGAVASYSCNPGFLLQGERTLECKDGRKWSAPPPRCQRLQCKDPGTSGRATRRVLGDFSGGSRIYFIPEEGYETEDKSVLLCHQNGTWDSATPHFTRTSQDSCSNDGEIDRFGRICNCVGGIQVDCCRQRQDWSTLSDAQRERYISTVLTVSSNPTYGPLYQELVNSYNNSFETLALSKAADTSQFITWHRYFLLEYENLLRLIHKDITIPYWDWTISSANLYSSPVFDPETGFGGSSDPETGCVSSGPFREGEFEVVLSNGSKNCLRRDYNTETGHVPPDRHTLEERLSLRMNMFLDFVQSSIVLRMRCFIGGLMCTTDAAREPLFPLLLARVDLYMQQWQERRNTNIAQHDNENSSPLVHSLDDFNSNHKLPYGTCVHYSPLQVPSAN